MLRKGEGESHHPADGGLFIHASRQDAHRAARRDLPLGGKTSAPTRSRTRPLAESETSQAARIGRKAALMLGGSWKGAFSFRRARARLDVGDQARDVLWVQNLFKP